MKQVIFSESKVRELKKFKADTEQLLAELRSSDHFLPIVSTSETGESRVVGEPEKKLSAIEKLKKWAQSVIDDLRGKDSRVPANEDLDNQFEMLETYFPHLYSDWSVCEAYPVRLEAFVEVRLILEEKLSMRLKSIERQIGERERTRKRLFRDKRAYFRAIVRLLFKNLDDEHGAVNNFQLDALRSYLPLNVYHGHKIFDRVALQAGRAAA